MTQASLSPDLNGTLGESPAADVPPRTGQVSESALWITALSAAGLLVAAVLLVGVLTQSVVTDASFGGFVSGVAIVIAALGVGALAYVLVTARRQGLLRASEAARAATRGIPDGMHAVPALPAELERRRRQQLQAERSERSRQAQAIATATLTPSTPRPAAPPVPRSGPAPVRPAATTVTLPAIRMPGPQVRRPRPGAWPRQAPVVRLAAPSAMPRTRVVMQQVNAANVRLQVPTRHR